jgi:hypothetical protein
MVEAAGSRRRLVGQPLLYAISVFASLGVFLVSRTYTIWHLNPSEQLSSLDTIRGLYFFIYALEHPPTHISSVMSGLITGPYFKSYFNNPDAVALGTMVAILEIGAFGEPYFMHCEHLWQILRCKPQ